MSIQAHIILTMGLWRSSEDHDENDNRAKALTPLAKQREARATAQSSMSPRSGESVPDGTPSVHEVQARAADVQRVQLTLVVVADSIAVHDMKLWNIGVAA